MSETREAYVERLKNQLDQWNTEIDALEAKAGKAEADAKAEYRQRVSELRRRYDDASKRLREVQASSETAWEKLKEGVEKSWNALRQGLEKARSSS